MVLPCKVFANLLILAIYILRRYLPSKKSKSGGYICCGILEPEEKFWGLFGIDGVRVWDPVRLPGVYGSVKSLQQRRLEPRNRNNTE
jgi:hypothetical protein